MSTIQGKGSAARVLIDFESSPGVTPAFASRRPVRVDFNSIDLQAMRALNSSNTIRGDRSATEPFQGNLDVSGNKVIPVDDKVIGNFLKGTIGDPVSSYAPGTQDKKIGSSLTLTISGGSGAGTFSVDQDDAAIGDRVIYEDSSGNEYQGFLTGDGGDGDTGTWVLSTTRDGAVACADITDATVKHIVRNSADGTPGTVTISGNVATFTATHANLAAAALLVYDTNKSCVIVEKLTDTTATVEGPGGDDVADATGVDVESLELNANWSHVFTVHPTASLSTFLVEEAFTDLDVPYFKRFTGCKVNTMEMPLGGDGELLATLALMGSTSVRTFQPYDKADHMTSTAPTVAVSGANYTFSTAQANSAAGDYVVYTADDGTKKRGLIQTRTNDTTGTFSTSPGDATAGSSCHAIYPSADSASIIRKRFGSKFQQFHAQSYLDGVAVQLFKTCSQTINNNNDGDQYLIGGGGTRTQIPEGIMAVSGNLAAILTDDALVEKAERFETFALKFILTHDATGNQLILEYPEVKMQQKSVGVSGPAGLMYEPDWQAFKNSGASVVIATLIGPEQSY